MKVFSLVFATLCGSILGAENPVEPETTPVSYVHNGTELLGHLAVPDGDGPFPAIIILP
jgi:hypothetical protein